MELKLIANTEPRKKFQHIRRLRKAAGHADELEKLCKSGKFDARTKLEAQVSALSILLRVPKVTLTYFYINKHKGSRTLLPVLCLSLCKINKFVVCFHHGRTGLITVRPLWSCSDE